MPLYEYRCAKCGNVFEVIQKFSDAPLTVHEACGGTVERLISRSGFALKGSGWYATDYPRSGSTPKESGSKESGDSKAESKPSETKSSESKSETKTESKPASTTKTDS
jgi:putative FmdB family regulatory protein